MVRKYPKEIDNEEKGKGGDEEEERKRKGRARTEIGKEEKEKTEEDARGNNDISCFDPHYIPLFVKSPPPDTSLRETI